MQIKKGNKSFSLLTFSFRKGCKSLISRVFFTLLGYKNIDFIKWPILLLSKGVSPWFFFFFILSVQAKKRPRKKGFVRFWRESQSFLTMFAAVPDRKLSKQEQGLEPTDREVNIQELGLEFRAPNPLRKPRPHDFPLLSGPLSFIPQSVDILQL